MKTPFRRWCWAAALATVLAGGRVLAQAPAPGGATFQRQLLEALNRGDRRYVARLFDYPMRANVPELGRQIPVNDAASLLIMYDLFFTPQMRCAIEQSRIAKPGAPAPPYPLMIAGDVVSMAGGRLVAEKKGGAYRITRFTIFGRPEEARKPQKVMYRWGDGEAQFSGRLSGGTSDSYVVTARSGDLLQARIERFPGRSLMLRVTQVATHRLIQGAPSEYARNWATRVDADGDYRVDVVHSAGPCGPEVTYLLTIGLRRE